jgi:hypothetical protein
LRNVGCVGWKKEFGGDSVVRIIEDRNIIFVQIEMIAICLVKEDGGARIDEAFCCQIQKLTNFASMIRGYPTNIAIRPLLDNLLEIDALAPL